MGTIQDQLREKGLSASLRDTGTPSNTNTSKKSKERLSRKEWEDLMGVNRETYQKQSGVYRRRR